MTPPSLADPPPPPESSTPDAPGLLVQMLVLAAVVVIALILLVGTPFAIALGVLGVLLVGGTLAAVWCTLRYLDFEGEGEPPCLPGRCRPGRRPPQPAPKRPADAQARGARGPQLVR
jgi:hypothetical protein